MIRAQGKIKSGFDGWLLVASVTLTAVMIIVTISLIVFLSNNLFKAFVPKENGESDLKFDLEGYQQVLKALNRTPAVINTE